MKSVSAHRPRPHILGIGGTTRAGSLTERVVSLALGEAERHGATTEIIGGAQLFCLPHFSADSADLAEAISLVDALRRCDGVILAAPAYHGAISGLMKNALDHVELLRNDARPYLEGRAVGCIALADGSQASSATLGMLRTIAHSLRGWPTPLGGALRAKGLLSEAGECTDQHDGWQVATIARQVVEFARRFQVEHTLAY